MLILIVAGGPDKGRIFELLDDTEVILGREGERVRLNDPKCSRRHAHLKQEDGAWYLTDNKSRHGTHVNHQPITQRTRVEPGDYIQVGKTVLVVGEMDTAHAERLALLGSTAAGAPAAELAEASAAPATRTSTRREPRPRTGLILGVAAIAAAVLIALNVAFYLSSANHNAQVRQQLAALEQRGPGAPTDTAKLEAMLAALQQRVAAEAEQQAVRDQQLGQTLAVVAGDPQQLAAKLDALARHIESLPDHSAELDAMAQAIASAPDPTQQLEALAAKLAALPDHSQQLAALTQAITEHPDYAPQLEQLAAAVQALPDYKADLAAVAKAIEAVPDHSEQLASLTQAVESRPDYSANLLAMAKTLEDGTHVTAQLPEGLAQQLADLAELAQSNSKALAALDTRLADAPDADRAMARVDKALGQMLDQLKRPAPEPSAEADPVMAALAQNQKHTDAMIDQVLAELKARPTLEDMVTGIEKQLAAARGVKPSRKTEELFKDVLEEIRKQPTAEDLAQQIARAQSEQGEADTQLLRQIIAKVQAVESLSPKLDELEKLVKANRPDDVQATLTQMQEAIAGLGTRLPDTDALLAEMAWLREQLPADHGDKLDAALAKLEQVPNAKSVAALEAQVARLAEAEAKTREAQALLADVLAVAKDTEATDAKLARIEALVARQPDVTRQAMDAALARMETLYDDTDQADAIALAIDEIRATVRGEVRAEMRAERIAAQREQAALAQAGAASYQAQPAAMVPPAGPAATVVQAQPAPTGADDGLSDTERAYKLAFESGKPVRLGGGKINPATGKQTDGRILDPEAARAAGISDWRDWYLMDDFAERMRLQRDATRFAADSTTDEDVVTLPASGPVIHASPENADR